MKKLIWLVFFLFIFGCLSLNKNPQNLDLSKQNTSLNEKNLPNKECLKDEDCACGKHIYTRQCYFGPKELVDISDQCPDFCTGIANQFEIKCINYTCMQVKKTTKYFCKDLCGDGICQEIVCLAEGCPCAENKNTCPNDCK